MSSQFPVKNFFLNIAPINRKLHFGLAGSQFLEFLEIYFHPIVPNYPQIEATAKLKQKGATHFYLFLEFFFFFLCIIAFINDFFCSMKDKRLDFTPILGVICRYQFCEWICDWTWLSGKFSNKLILNWNIIQIYFYCYFSVE